jgi:hypothetical protein
MIFLVLSRKGFECYLSVAANDSAPLWVSAGVLSQSELDELHSRGINITNFNYEIGLDETEVIENAIETIREHHPDKVIWVQR